MSLDLISGKSSLVNIGLGNGLVLSGNNPLPEPMFPRPYSVSRHMASPGLNELSL